MSSLRKLSAREAAERLLSLSSPVILMHVRPDGDTTGSCSALLKILRAVGIEAEYASSDKIPERLEFLLEGEKEAKTLEGRDLVAIDVASKAQLGSLSYLADTVKLTIDHHEVSTPFSDNYTVADASSAAEVLFEVLSELIEMKKCELTKEIAYPIYAAISSDTGGFLFSSAKPLTYIRAARLMETGIDFSDINHRLFHSKPKEQIKAEGFISTKLTSLLDGRVTYATLSNGEREALGLLPEHFETAIDVVRSVLHTEIAIFVRENADGSVKASIRSTGHNVAAVAAKFGGGGHIRAAGCTLPTNSAEEGARIVTEEIKKLYL